MHDRLKIALLRDPAEEGWPSMDLVAEMLTDQIRARHDRSVSVELLSAPWRKIGLGSHNLDRLMNRFIHYPKFVQDIERRFDVFHILDHSYAHLALSLPRKPTVATCHDIDSFRVFWEGGNGFTVPVRRLMARHILKGLRRCAAVACDSIATQNELTGRGLYPTAKTVVIPLGVHPAFWRPIQLAELRALEHSLGPASSSIPEILHVGMNVPRKRIEWLIEIFASVHRNVPGARLIRVGGDLTMSQRRLARKLGVDRHISTLSDISRSTLGALYRRAALVLLPSEREGFGFPVLEAMAVGTPVVVTDLAVLREVGGSEATYCQPSSIDSWTCVIEALLQERATSPGRWERRRQRCRQQASQFTWARTADQLVAIYRDVAVPRSPNSQPVLIPVQ